MYFHVNFNFSKFDKKMNLLVSEQYIATYSVYTHLGNISTRIRNFGSFACPWRITRLSVELLTRAVVVALYKVEPRKDWSMGLFWT